MALTPGTRLGGYQITAQIGEGGMGQVWRARDTKLNRDVALKVLPDSFATDPDRLARFTREAQTLASLNHPNIAGIYGIEESGGVSALVMELVDGEDLSTLIANGQPEAERVSAKPRPSEEAARRRGWGPGATGESGQPPGGGPSWSATSRGLPFDDALQIARQIAEALEAAHERGIIHRDLKPANIKVRADGTVKVLDFGLAKALTPEGPSATAGSFANSPTITSPAMTQVGMILGTAAYMSPEQARGRPVDKRADIWAFGAVLFEMLTGRRAFAGDEITDLIVAVISTDPDWFSLPPSTPSSVRSLLRRCLDKEPKRRLRDIGEARLALEDAQSEPASVPKPMVAPVPHRTRLLQWTALAAGAIALAATSVVTFRHWQESPPTAATVQFSVAPPAGTTLVGTPALSPDGRVLAFPAAARNVTTLYVRPIAALDARPLVEGVVAGTIIWSPDSRAVAFVADGKLKRVALDGSPSVTLCDVNAMAGGSWSARGIAFGSPAGALQLVSSEGGTPRPLTTLGDGETSHRWPTFLPDGKGVLYLARKGSAGRLAVVSVDSGTVTDLGPAEMAAQYASGYLLYQQAGTLVARSFDTGRLQFTGDPVSVTEALTSSPAIVGSGARLFSAVDHGALVFVAGDVDQQAMRLTWMNRGGVPQGTVGDPGVYTNLAISRDGRQVAASLGSGSPWNQDIWLFDLTRDGTARRLTFDPASDADPAFSPDGTQVVFNSQRPVFFSLYRRAADGSGEDERLAGAEGSMSGPSWSPDGRFLIYAAISPTTLQDLWVLPMTGDRRPFLFLQTPFVERGPAFSPDGHWVAYESNASGRREVYVRPFPNGGGEFKVSRDGGWSPGWRADGRELFFLALDGTMMAADIDTARALSATVPKPLFSTGTTITTNVHPWAVRPDGQRFLIKVAESRASDRPPITVVLNWPAMTPRRSE